MDEALVLYMKTEPRKPKKSFFLYYSMLESPHSTSSTVYNTVFNRKTFDVLSNPVRTTLNGSIDYLSPTNVIKVF